MRTTLTHPQTVAESLADNMCLACCYIFLAGQKADFPVNDASCMSAVINCWREGLVDNECTCYAPEKILKFLTGKSAVVTKIEDQQQIAKILNSDEPCIAFYSIDGLNGHFVVMEHNKIIFNSLAKSKNVEKGTIHSLRRIQWR